jgi:hypothetical protein
MRFIILFIFIFFGLHAQSQHITYKFRIRFGDYSPLSNAQFILSGQRMNTDPQGIIDISLANNINYLNIESANLKAYEIKYPFEGKAMLPKDPTVFIDVFVAKPGPDQLKGLVDRMDRSQTNLQKNLYKKIEEETRNGYDGIVKMLTANNLDEQKLAKGRLEFFPLISATLANYLNEVRNFNDAFVTLSTSLNSKPAYDQFSNAIYRYNEIFDLLNNNKNTYEQAIATYWNSKELSLKFNNLVDYAIEDLHKPYVLEINYTLINRIYAANNETNRKKRAQLQDILTKDMTDISSNMTRKINGLGERITAMNGLLNNNGTIKIN